MTSFRRLTSLLTAAVITASCAACVQLPRPTTGESAPRPALAGPGVGKVMRHYWAVEDKAWDRNDTSHLVEVSTDSDLAVTAAAININKQAGKDDDSGNTKFTSTFTAYSSPGGRYPAKAVVLEKMTVKGQPTTYYAYNLKRASAADPWLVSFVMQADLRKHLPRTAGTAQGGRIMPALDPGQKVNGLTAEQVPGQVAAALEDPHGTVADRFDQNAAFTSVMATPDTGTDKGRPHRSKYTWVTPSSWTDAYLDTHGDLVVFGNAALVVEWSYRDGWYSYFTRKSDIGYAILGPHGYSNTHWTYYVEFAVLVPKKGKLKLLRVEPTLSSLTGVREPHADR